MCKTTLPSSKMYLNVLEGTCTYITYISNYFCDVPWWEWWLVLLWVLMVSSVCLWLTRSIRECAGGRTSPRCQPSACVSNKEPERRVGGRGQAGEAGVSSWTRDGPHHSRQTGHHSQNNSITTMNSNHQRQIEHSQRFNAKACLHTSN